MMLKILLISSCIDEILTLEQRQISIFCQQSNWKEKRKKKQRQGNIIISSSWFQMKHRWVFNVQDNIYEISSGECVC